MENRRADEEVTSSRVLTIEHTLTNLGERMVELGSVIEAEREENKTFQTLIIKKLDEKSDFNLLNTMKTVLTTIAIVAAITAAIDYRINSAVSVVTTESDHRDMAILSLRKDVDAVIKDTSKMGIELSNTQKEVSGNSDFVDHFTYTEKYPIQINSLKSEIKMLKYRIGESR